MDKRYLNKLRKLGVCQAAIDWASTQETPEKAWAACERGDWMLQWCGKQAGRPWSAARKKLVLAACECARLALPYVQTDKRVPVETLETAEGWAHGKATREEVMDAASSASAHAACGAAASSASAHAACGAAYAASASARAAYGAAYAAEAAYVSAYGVAYAAEERKKVLKECADIVRKYYPKPPGLMEGSHE